MSLTAKNNKRSTKKRTIQPQGAGIVNPRIPIDGIQPPKKFTEMNEMLKKTKFLEDRK